MKAANEKTAPHELRRFTNEALLLELSRRKVLKHLQATMVIDGRITRSDVTPEQLQRYETLKLTETLLAAVMHARGPDTVITAERVAYGGGDLPPGSYTLQADGLFISAACDMERTGE